MKVNEDPNIDDDVDFPAANMSSSGGQRVPQAAEDDDDFDY